MGVAEHRGFEGLSSQKTNVDDILSLTVEETENHDITKQALTSEPVSTQNEVFENATPKQKTNTKSAWLWVAGMVFIAFVIGQMGSTSSVVDEPSEDYIVTEEAAPYEEEVTDPTIEEAAEPIYESAPTYDDSIYSEPIETAVPYESDPYDNGYSDNYGQNSDNSY